MMDAGKGDGLGGCGHCPIVRPECPRARPRMCPRGRSDQEISVADDELRVRSKQRPLLQPPNAETRDFRGPSFLKGADSSSPPPGEAGAIPAGFRIGLLDANSRRRAAGVKGGAPGAKRGRTTLTPEVSGAQSGFKKVNESVAMTLDRQGGQRCTPSDPSCRGPGSPIGRKSFLARAMDGMERCGWNGPGSVEAPPRRGVRLPFELAVLAAGLRPRCRQRGRPTRCSNSDRAERRASPGPYGFETAEEVGNGRGVGILTGGLKQA